MFNEKEIAIKGYLSALTLIWLMYEVVVIFMTEIQLQTMYHQGDMSEFHLLLPSLLAKIFFGQFL